ncbi:MAG: VOC family protein [Ahrensia sp.]|nr:VOC family protein [Ahrensia sp.]
MNRLMVNIVVADVAKSAAFYEALFGFQRAFDSDWFCNLQQPNKGGAELGIMKRGHDIVPPHLASTPGSTYLTIVADDVETVFEAATKAGHVITEPPTNMFYGQRRMLLHDPDGYLIDISSPTVAG